MKTFLQALLLCLVAICVYCVGIGRGRAQSPQTILPGDFAVRVLIEPGRETRIYAPAHRCKMEINKLSGEAVYTIDTKPDGK